MSPRRRVATEEPGFFAVAAPRRPRRWGLPLVAAMATLLLAAAITASTFFLVQNEMDRRADEREASVLYYARGFMTAYTSLDPFNANAYADRILEQGTGAFVTKFKERKNQILIQVARGQPTTGAVLEAGVQRWHDDGSADVLVATKVTTESPDGKTIESGSRWVATVTQEGQQWKISQLVQVI